MSYTYDFEVDGHIALSGRTFVDAGDLVDDAVVLANEHKPGLIVNRATRERYAQYIGEAACM